MVWLCVAGNFIQQSSCHFYFLCDCAVGFLSVKPWLKLLVDDVVVHGRYHVTLFFFLLLLSFYEILVEALSGWCGCTWQGANKPSPPAPASTFKVDCQCRLFAWDFEGKHVSKMTTICVLFSKKNCSAKNRFCTPFTHFVHSIVLKQICTCKSYFLSRKVQAMNYEHEHIDTCIRNSKSNIMFIMFIMFKAKRSKLFLRRETLHKKGWIG